MVDCAQNINLLTNCSLLIELTCTWDTTSHYLTLLTCVGWLGGGDVHWLPVEQKIEYKLLLPAFKSVNNCLSYLSDLLKFYISSRQLHFSSDIHLLRIPSFCLKSFGQRKFSYQASVLWNSLPISLHHYNSTLAFKSALKTHLFLSQ